MKTKIAYLVALVCALTFATSAFADAEEQFYKKDQIRGFISFGGDFRGMFDDFHSYVNSTALMNGGHMAAASDADSTKTAYAGKLKYGKFDDYYIGLHVNVGAQYKQFLTWINMNFMPTQVSERPSSTYVNTSADGNSMKFPLYDVRWFSYGADWMFGWKLFGENTFINLIPSVGLGFNLINFHLASNFDFEDLDSPGTYVSARDRYYSTMAMTFNSELELRIELGQFGIGIYGGYRYAEYNDLEIENNVLVGEPYDTDNSGETWFAGLRLTWTFLSDWQSKQAEKL
ncbi:hypothetical protein [Fibrobacter sp.]|uniref:hypothetical protein n=1 Tax=Fibrobacter sp. TaxID=35828 RepID=UPI00388D9E76